jgi:hypothetical protein
VGLRLTKALAQRQRALPCNCAVRAGRASAALSLIARELRLLCWRAATCTDLPEAGRRAPPQHLTDRLCHLGEKEQAALGGVRLHPLSVPAERQPDLRRHLQRLLALPELNMPSGTRPTIRLEAFVLILPGLIHKNPKNEPMTTKSQRADRSTEVGSWCFFVVICVH